MNKIIPILLGSLALTGYANAADDGNFIIMDDDTDIIQKSPSYSSYKTPKRTSFFSGMEYTEAVADENPKNSAIKYIVADGSTRVHENWRIRYVLSQRLATKKGDEREDKLKQTNFTIAPRYEQWVNPWFSFFAEPVYVHQSVAETGQTNTEIKLRPGLQFKTGKHGLNTNYTHSFVEKEFNNGNPSSRFETFEVKATYLYRFMPKINFGLEFVRNGYVDNSDRTHRRRAFGIKPAVRVSHWKGIVTEFSVPYNYNETNALLKGTESVKFNVNNNYRINKNMKLVANFAYTQVKSHQAGVDLGNDKEGFGAKLGFNLSF